MHRSPAVAGSTFVSSPSNAPTDYLQIITRATGAASFLCCLKELSTRHMHSLQPGYHFERLEGIKSCRDLGRLLLLLSMCLTFSSSFSCLSAIRFADKNSYHCTIQFNQCRCHTFGVTSHFHQCYLKTRTFIASIGCDPLVESLYILAGNKWDVSSEDPTPDHGSTPRIVVSLPSYCSVFFVQATQTLFNCLCSWAKMGFLDLWCD